MTDLRTGLRVLAVDGGQSAIRVRASAREGDVEVERVSRVGGHDDRVAAAVESAWRSLGCPVIDRAVLGMTTAPTDADRAIALAQRVGLAIDGSEVWVCDDAVTSHAGALDLGWGASLTAGTGVACLVVPEDGDARIVGGHGYLLGDEGGAFWIGREGLRAALRAAEGRSAQTALGELATRRFGSLDDLPVRLHEDTRSVDMIARFAPDVIEAADRDDLAADVVHRAAAELSGVVGAAVRHVRAAGTSGPVPVGLGGRLLADATPLRRALDACLAMDGSVDARTADASPLDGAMLLGRQGSPGRYAALVRAWRRGAA